MKEYFKRFSPLDLEGKKMFLKWMVGLSSLAISYFILRFIFIVGEVELIYYAITLFLLNISSLFLLKNHFNYSAILSCISTFCILILLIYESGGVRAPGLDWFMMTIPVYGMLFNGVAAILALLCSFLVIIVFYIYEDQIPLPGYFENADHYSQAFITNSFVFLFFNFIIYLVYSNFLIKYKKLNAQKVEQVDALLKVIIHDLATPLNVLTLTCDKLKAETSDLLGFDKVTRSLTSMHGIIDKVKDMRQLNQGTIKAKIVDVLIDNEIEFCVLLFAELANRKGIALETELALGNYKVKTDPNLFKFEIINNILSNALKFSETGSTITIKSFLDEASGRPIVQIIDEGPGISADVLETMYSNERMISQVGSGGEKGHGFGFEIIKTFTELLKIEFTIESPCRHGRGTMVELTL